MENKPDIEMYEYELIWAIVNFGQGSKVLKIANQNGVSGGTVFLGKGTIKNRWLEFLELTDVRKEIVLMAVEKFKAVTLLDVIGKEMEFNKPYHGIAFTTPLTSILKYDSDEYIAKKSGGTIMYHSIITIVEQDKAELVLDAANKAGARGGTVISGRGAGAFEASKIFSMDIEPQKDIVLILSEVSGTRKIVEAIRDKLEIGKPGKGVIFCQDVSNTYGLFSKK